MVYVLTQEDIWSEYFNFYEQDGNLMFTYNGNYDATYDPITSILEIQLDPENEQIRFKIIDGQIYIYVPTGTPRRWGEFIVSKFDELTSMNIFFPKTPTGMLLYHLYGFGLDNFEDKLIQQRLNLSPITCDWNKLNEFAKEYGFQIDDLSLINSDEIRAYILRHKYNTRILKTLNEVIKWIEFAYNDELQTFLKQNDEEIINEEELWQRLVDWDNYKPCKNENGEFIKNPLFFNIEWTDLAEKFYNFGKDKYIPTYY